jgi:hypothetical protein
LDPYKVLVVLDFLKLARPSRHDRDQLLSFLEALEKNPFQLGDFEEPDDVGRSIQIKIIGAYAVSFWADHAVKEVKVVKIEKADRP